MASDLEIQMNRTFLLLKSVKTNLERHLALRDGTHNSRFKNQVQENIRNLQEQIRRLEKIIIDARNSQEVRDLEV